jgi:hypothetical protein
MDTRFAPPLKRHAVAGKTTFYESIKIVLLKKAVYRMCTGTNYRQPPTAATSFRLQWKNAADIDISYSMRQIIFTDSHTSTFVPTFLIRGFGG